MPASPLHMERRKRGEVLVPLWFKNHDSSYLAGINQLEILMFRFVPGSIFLLLFVSACTNNTIGKRKDIDPDAIFFEYIIRGDEDDTNVTLYLQFRIGGPNGYTLTLKDPAKVELDGELSRLTAPNLPVRTMRYKNRPNHSSENTRSHLPTLTRKSHSQEFEYKPFSMETELDEVERGDLVFELEGLEKEDYLHVSATDTSFNSRDIVEIDTVKDGKLIIPAHNLRYLVDGPITLLLSKETQKIIRNEIRGRITVSYALKREFELGP
jgi:hypothetical protein